MLKKVLVALVIIIFAFLGLVALQPAEFRVTRSATVAAPPTAVFAQVNDFHNWQAWSPWAKLDPAAKSTFAGAPSGPGATFAWAGNDKVGEGSMTITESRPGERVAIDLNFRKPMAARDAAEFTFKPEGDRTSVTWSMSGKRNFFCKAVCLFVNVDKMVGGDFERGLAQLKAVAEAPPARQPGA